MNEKRKLAIQAKAQVSRLIGSLSSAILIENEWCIERITPLIIPAWKRYVRRRQAWIRAERKQQ